MTRKAREGGRLWVRNDEDRGKLRDAELARLNRREIQHALSSGEVSRRDLVKWGLFSTTGTAPSSSGANGTGVPTGLPASPTFGVAPFSSPLSAANPDPGADRGDLPGTGRNSGWRLPALQQHVEL